MNDNNDNKTESLTSSDISMNMSEYTIENGLIYIHKKICINDCCRRNNINNLYETEGVNKNFTNIDINNNL